MPIPKLIKKDMEFEQLSRLIVKKNFPAVNIVNNPPSLDTLINNRTIGNWNLVNVIEESVNNSRQIFAFGTSRMSSSHIVK